MKCFFLPLCPQLTFWSSKRPAVQFGVKTGGPPLGQSIRVHHGQQQAAYLLKEFSLPSEETIEFQ